MLRFWLPFAAIAVLLVSALTWKPSPPDTTAETITEIRALSAALESYRERYGEYPPDFSDETIVAAHVHNVLPNYAGPIPAEMTAPQALVFWLSGFAEGDDPFAARGKRTPLFRFDPARLVIQENGEVYLPPGVKETGQPYYYFDHLTYWPIAASGAIGSKATPYAAAIGTDGMPTEWVNPTSFQIVAAGRDNKFGQPATWKSFPGPRGWSSFDADNLTNFYDAAIGLAK